MKMEIEDITNNLLRIERKLDVLLAMQNLWVDPETLEVKEIEEDEDKEDKKVDDVEIKSEKLK